MYHYPTHYEPRYEYPVDYTYSHLDLKPRVKTTRYYNANPYITSYNDGRFELLRRTPIYSSPFTDLALEGLRRSRASSLARSCSPDREEFRRSVRASSIPPRAASPEREEFRRSIRASSVPPITTSQEPTSFRPSLSYFTPKLATGTSFAPTYSYYSRLPVEAGDKMSEPTKRMYSPNPISFGPKMYTSLSVFPTMRHSAYSLMEPIDRYRYRTAPQTKCYNTNASTRYYSYPTPTTSTSSAYRKSDLYPTRFQINRVTSPSLERFYAGRRTLY